MNASGVADVDAMLEGVPETDRAIVIFAVDAEGGCVLRRSGFSKRATANVLRAMADEIDASLVAGLPEDATIQ